jgi:tetrahydromethanopterin S-methyltransferase subunit H
MFGAAPGWQRAHLTDLASLAVNVKWFVDGVQLGYGSHVGVPAKTTVLNDNSAFTWTATAGAHTISSAWTWTDTYRSQMRATTRRL